MRKLLVFGILTISLLTLFSCKSTKCDSPEMEYLIQLNTGLDETYVVHHFQRFTLTKIRRSSKSQNLWSATLQCHHKKQKDAFEKELSADKNVLSYKLAPTSPSGPTNDTNVGKITVKPTAKQ